MYGLTQEQLDFLLKFYRDRQEVKRKNTESEIGFIHRVKAFIISTKENQELLKKQIKGLENRIKTLESKLKNENTEPFVYMSQDQLDAYNKLDEDSKAVIVKFLSQK